LGLWYASGGGEMMGDEIGYSDEMKKIIKDTMLGDKTIKPTNVSNITNTLDYLHGKGIDDDMIVALINDRTKIGKTRIRDVITAIRRDR
jgi:hypothetical protein